VLKKNIVEGKFVQEGQAMFEIADLETVWVKARVFEDEVGLVQMGQAVEATVEAYPGQVFPGKVEFVFPHLDPATRTVEVRYDLDNSGHRLRPGMFATVTLKTPVARTPMFAALHSGGPMGVRTGLTAEEQKICPVEGAELGTMGPPVAAEVGGQKVWTCCDACPPKIKADPARYLAKLTASASGTTKVMTAQEQKLCPVTGARLGSMGDPIAVDVEGRKVWLCCDSCPPKLKANPAKYLAKLAPAPQAQDAVLTVPESAVIDTGKDKIVYVEAEPGVFEGRKVVVGPRSGDLFPVLEGLAPGEKVATTGAFLIDAESRINPATRGGASEQPSTQSSASSPAPAPPPPPPSRSAAVTDDHRQHVGVIRP
jgi:hypothetical protein